MSKVNGVIQEINEISNFVREVKIIDSVPEMEIQLSLAIGYSQRIGELVNEAERGYSLKKADSLIQLQISEEETETTRKVKLDAWTADEKKLWRDLLNIQTHLRQRIMSLFQGIKTRREER